MLENLDLSALITIIGGLVIIVNIIVQVLKQLIPDNFPTNILVVIVSMVLTMAAGAIYAAVNSIHIVWYMIIAALIAGMLVAYAAMFGFDKLKEALKGLKNTESGE